MSDYYWQTTTPQEEKSSGTKIIAVIVILMITISSGLIFILQVVPLGGGPSTEVRVAVLDSGIDIDLALQGRVVEEKSFIEPQYGYDETDITTTDSRPENVPHGTLVATLVAETPNAQIVNGKVMGEDGTATSIALAAAIYWAVEQECGVISLSLGSSPVLGDPMEEAIEWAFSRGVVVVSSAGNEGDSGLAGNSISSPSVFEKCIAVAALYEDDEPAEFSSTGPTFDRYMKPDISAYGWVTYSSSRYYGTSFSAPRVAGAAAQLIGYSIDNNITYTPGSIMTALMKGAEPMTDYPSYVVGTGKLNVQNSLALLDTTSQEGELPALSLAFPASLPIDYETLFYDDTYEFNVRLLTSGSTTFTVAITGDSPGIFNIPSSIAVNQSRLIPLTVNMPSSGPSVLNNTIQFTSAEFGETSLDVSFELSSAIARVAFDISHSSWSIDTSYGQFREFYKELTANDISVTEIRNSTATTLAVLQQFDSVVILDPCVYDYNETIPTVATPYSLPFSGAEKTAYAAYYDAGGGIFLATLGSSFTNITQVNDFLSFTGFELTAVEVPSGTDPALIVDLENHIITSGLSGFHYLGATLNIPLANRLASFHPAATVMGYKESVGGGKIVVTGTNFFIDNYALLGEYGVGDNALIAYRIVLWTAGLLF
ncbi:MAG: S8 family serine peptidase [Candidatus Thorarchaeota archaeon]|nr:S8 family serine peptidase [Candidatus Thorarchaeota archaeon]